MNKIFSFLLLTIALTGSSQVGPKSWQDHLGINACNTVTKIKTKIYASYFNGLIYFDESEISPQSLNKINGLSDVGIRLLRGNPYNNKLLVIYDNCNIDVIDESGNITNYTQFKQKSMTAKKVVNEVTFYKQFAYLACGFGIVVFDTEKLEVKDTYIIGPNANNLEVFQLALNDSLIFAATPLGLFRANHKTKILNNFNNWYHDTISLPKGNFCGVVNVGGNIISCYSLFSVDLTKSKDSVYLFKNNSWIKYPPLKDGGWSIRKFCGSNDSLFSYLDQFGLVVINANQGKLHTTLNQFNEEPDPVNISDACFGKDHTGNLSFWMADMRYGLYQSYYDYLPDNRVTRNGTNRNAVCNIDMFNGEVAVSPSYINNAGTGNYSREGLNLFQNDEWSYLPVTADGESVIDVTSVLFDRKDPGVVWACAWAYGVLKYKNKKLVTVYTPSNSPMPKNIEGLPRCSGLSMDKNGNVWVAQSDQLNLLSVIKRNGQLQNFTFEEGGFTRKTFVDRNNYVWMLHEREGGITVYKNTNFSSPVKGVNYKLILKDIGKGNLGSNSVYSIAEDKDGKIWVGTAEGVRVFYNPTAIFSGSDFDAQPIKIIQDGNVELLLGKETISTIAVDGANNKWVGTAQGGVYCFSPDGINELYHFTKENSPLYSNTVVDINYNEVTGDLYIGTEQGLQSFRGIVIAGNEDYNSIQAYPNPVRPNYAGTVLVRGLIDNSIVKITDEAGNIVWETKSTGGQIEWPLKTFSGSRVTSGVYIVYSSTTDGEVNALTKILVVN